MIMVNGQRRDFTPESVTMLMENLGVDPRGVAVAVNGEIVPRAQWTTTFLTDESRIEILSAAAGG